jgi:hypothetical protein
MRQKEGAWMGHGALEFEKGSFRCGQSLLKFKEEMRIENGGS